MTDQPENTALAYVSVGSNIQPEHHIDLALQALMCRAQVTAVSTFYRTEPIGRPEQGSYVNGVFEVRTDVPARDMACKLLHPVETQLGRVRSEDRYAPRTMDLDLILYNDVTRCDASVKLPHPDIDRVFVWAPILELLARDVLVHPCKQAMLEMLPTLRMPASVGVPLVTFTDRLKANMAGA